MVLLASDFDKSKYLKAADLSGEKKFRIKSVSVEEIGNGEEGAQADTLVHERRARLAAQPHQPAHLQRRLRRQHGGVGRQDHRRVSDDGRHARQDGAGPAGAYPAAEAGVGERPGRAAAEACADNAGVGRLRR